MNKAPATSHGSHFWRHLFSRYSLHPYCGSRGHSHKLGCCRSREADEAAERHEREDSNTATNGADGELVGEAREESPERGIQPKGRHPGTGPLDVPIQHTPSSFNRHALVASFKFPLKLSPRSSDSQVLPPHFPSFGFPDPPKTRGEQKGLVACEEVTSTYRYDRRCWSDVLLVLMKELFCFPRLVYTLCNNNGR